MSLAKQAWRYVGSQTFATANCQSVMDAAYTLGTAVTYDDTTTRTPGSGSAWTWSRFQNAGTTEAVYATPPTDTLNTRLIVAGTTAAPGGSFALASPDITPAGNQLHVSLTKNAGAFSAWDGAAIFTSGQDWDYWRIWPTSAGTGAVRMWEGIEACAWLIGTASSWYGFIGGGIADPESTDALDQESDGKRYGLITSGINAVVGSGFLTASGFGHHGTGSGANHAGLFTPGAVATKDLMNPTTIPRASTTTTWLKTRSGLYVRQPITYNANGSAPNDYLLGRLREIMFFCDSKIPLKQTGVGYIFGGSAAADQDCFFLEHA